MYQNKVELLEITNSGDLRIFYSNGDEITIPDPDGIYHKLDRLYGKDEENNDLTSSIKDFSNAGCQGDFLDMTVREIRDTLNKGLGGS